MSKLLQAFKSKKGFSLAYAMVVCLFLALVTGSITTVALLQHNETGSDLNTRQAYISAKSGLESVKNHMTNGTVNIDTTGLSDEGDSKFFVMYTDNSGNVQIHYENTEAAIQNYIDNSMPEGATIVGGEGTYYKVTLKEDGVIGVTSLNQTGKYNNNVTINKGDLTFDAITYTKYTVKEKNATPPDDDDDDGDDGDDGDDDPPEDEIPEDVPAPPGEDESEDDEPEIGPPVQRVTDPPTSSYSTSGKFLMIGQQYAYNDATIIKGSAEGSQAGLLKSEGREDAVDWDSNDAFYHAQVETKDDDYASYVSYFPVVYDKMLKVTSNADRSAIEAFNQGIYFCGDFEGYRSGDQYANTYSFDEYQAKVKNGNTSDVNRMGVISYTTINTQYQLSMGCNFMCIEHNVVNYVQSYNIKHIKVYYSGTQSSLKNGRIYVYIPYGITIYNCKEDKSQSSPYYSYFTIPKGYYYFDNEFELTDIYDWYNSSYVTTSSSGALTCRSGSVPKNKVTNASDLAEAEARNLHGDILEYEANGTIHSGGKEENNASNVTIINSDTGKYNSSTSSPYYSTNGSSFSYSSAYDNSNIFLAPRFSMGNNNPNNVGSGATAGVYHWYCGKTFNFQWFREFDFQVPSSYNIEISAPTIVLTIGPTIQVYDGSKNKVTTSTCSNKIVSTGSNNSFKLCGGKGKGSANLRVMCDFVVEYSGKSYTVKEGSYTLPACLNLFSDTARNYFNSQSGSNAAACIVAPGLSKQTFTLSSVFANMFRGTFIANSAFVVQDSDDDGVVDVSSSDLAPVSGRVDSLDIPKGISDVKYTTKSTYNGTEVFKLTVKDGFKICKEYDGGYVDYMVFEGLTNGANFDCLVPTNSESVLYLEECHKHLEQYKTSDSSNYTITSETVTEIIGEYY